MSESAKKLPHKATDYFHPFYRYADLAEQLHFLHLRKWETESKEPLATYGVSRPRSILSKHIS